METREFKIQVPEGYEIDKENSTFECIKFKPIKKAMTYEDVARELFKDKEICYINAVGSTVKGKVEKEYVLDPNNCTSKEQAEKLIAINKLMNVAKYLNAKEKRREDGIAYYIKENCGIVMVDWTVPKKLNLGEVNFNSYDIAKQAIEILGRETIKTALSTDW